MSAQATKELVQQRRALLDEKDHYVEETARMVHRARHIILEIAAIDARLRALAAPDIHLTP